jgi:UDP-glucuronate decarboxylase
MASPDSVVGPINLGNPIEYSMLQLAETILDLTGSRSRIVHRPLPQDDPRQRQPNITKAKELLGWMPMMSLKEGLIKTIAYFEDLLGEPGIMEILGGSSEKKVEATKV